MTGDRWRREREDMVARQLMARDIRNERVLEAFRAVPRHEFVPPDMRSGAYADHPLPIGSGQTISQPYMVALMTQCLELTGGERVLEIGTGSGYQAAILAVLAREVYTVERHESLAMRASPLLDVYPNVHVKVGDGTEGWPEHAPYDGIIVTAGAPEAPPPLMDQLADGGRLVIPVGGSFSQTLMVFTRRGKRCDKRTVCGCVFVPLVGKHGWKGQGR
ncbi:MAG: protein-L-isoaspartate(D-aspartate) O-methyltransferase [Candidatus Tritonobacter lacicola]|nr:protein-L-isoaspartate(D-aspartate) O-methyltransferase [Candidatus Tritonobacter lacicola]